jgi:gluconokinase
MIVIVMGVSGAGKSTIGQALADVLGWQFVEGDRLHSDENIDKMRRGIALTDEDRWPWLIAIRQTMDDLQAAGHSAVVSCSALKQRYRDYLQDDCPETVQFVYLKGRPETLLSRLEHRQGHFMKGRLLHSQLAALEEPSAALVVPIDQLDSPEQAVAEICAWIRDRFQE